MADFLTELRKYMGANSQYAQGIPNIEAQKQDLLRQGQIGGEKATAYGREGLNKAGLGQSVAQGFLGMGNQAQYRDMAQKSIVDLLQRHGELKGQQQLQLLSQMAPLAYEQSQKPGWFAQLAGGALGLAGQFGLPGIGGGGPLAGYLQSILGGNKGQGMATTPNFGLH